MKYRDLLTEIVYRNKGNVAEALIEAKKLVEDLDRIQNAPFECKGDHDGHPCDGSCY